MAFRVVWTELAWLQLKSISSYVVLYFGKNVANKMNIDISHHCHYLSIYPYLGKVEPYLDNRAEIYRSLVVSKKLKLIYRVDEKKCIVYVSDLWDCRRNPDDLVSDL